MIDVVRAAVTDDLARLAGHRMRTLAVTVIGLHAAVVVGYVRHGGGRPSSRTLASEPGIHRQVRGRSTRMVNTGGLLFRAGFAQRRPVRQARRSDQAGSDRPRDSKGRSEHRFPTLVAR